MFKLFESLLPDVTQGLTLPVFAVCLLSALVLGAMIALCYTYRTACTGSFVITLSLLPAITCVVVMMVSGSLGAGVAVAGAFSLVRFRSNPGTAKEICAVFFSMAAGLACGMGRPGFGALFSVVLCLVNLFYEAIGLGAVHAGISLAAGYPGTPSTEILETVANYNKEKRIHVEWSVNEKAALEVAAGASYAGARTLVTMKQVGLNVASDPVMSLAYIGVEGGMVIVAADDPGPISSQTEQDTRRFGAFFQRKRMKW